MTAKDLNHTMFQVVVFSILRSLINIHSTEILKGVLLAVLTLSVSESVSEAVVSYPTAGSFYHYQGGS